MHLGAGLQRGEDRQVGPRRQVDLRARRQVRRAGQPTAFGIVRWTSKKPFSADAKDWGKGRFKSDISNPAKGVIDWALSPDGKTVAAVANFDSDAFQLYFAKPKDFLLTDAKPQGVRACKAAWRSDGQEIVVVQADQFCAEPNGQLARDAGQEPAAPSSCWASAATTPPSSR